MRTHQLPIVLFIIITILPTFKLKAQDTLVAYYNSDWEKVKKKHKASADHYRHSFIDKNGAPVFRCYFMTGELRAEGEYKSKKFKWFNGAFKSYHKDGSLRSQGHFLEGNKTGKWSYWYDNGNLMNITHYNEEGEKHGEFKSWYKDSTLEDEGIFNHGKEEGKWDFYFENGQIASSEVYKEGELKSFKFWDEEGNELDTVGRKIFERINYVNNQKHLFEYIHNNFVYPPKASKMGIEGRVLVDFVINKKGELIKLTFRGSNNKSFRAEAERLMRGYSNWTPAKYHNRKVSSSYTLPIVFQMSK